MKIAQHFERHFVGIEMAGADAGDGFDVSGDAFFDPMMIVGDGRE